MQATVTAPQAPPAPAPGEAVIATGQAGTMRPLTQREVEVIRERRQEMSSQLTSAQRRREGILDDIRSAPAGTEAGLQQQYQVLSDRIVAIERDIEASGQTLRNGLVPEGTILVPPNDRPGGMSEEAMTVLGLSVSLFFLFPLAIGAMRLMFRRARRPAVAVPSPEQEARMERLEQAVDAVALEIERVGESQRFQARLLAEANLMPAMAAARPAVEPVRVQAHQRGDRLGDQD